MENESHHDNRPITRRVVPLPGLLVLVVPIGVAAVLLSAATDRLDSALLFVGTPLLLALLVAAVPSSGASSAIFQVVTIVLLLTSALLHEGALCVLIASPLVYGVAFLVLWIARGVDGRQRLAIAPLFLLVALEGVVPGLRANPDQQVSADHVVAADCAHFEKALERGPQFAPENRGWLLDLAQYPTPVGADHDGDGTGLEVGDAWTLAMPSGSITTEVTGREEQRINFEVTEDSARTERWVTLEHASLTWQETARGCTATVRIDFTRHLDPSFYFGPVTHVFMSAGADAFLRGLASSPEAA